MNKEEQLEWDKRIKAVIEGKDNTRNPVDDLCILGEMIRSDAVEIKGPKARDFCFLLGVLTVRIRNKEMGVGAWG